MKYTFLILAVFITLLGADEELLRTADQMIKVGDHQKAEIRLRAAIKEDPENPDILWRLGQALNRKAETLTGMERHDTFEEASTYLSVAVKRGHKMPEPHVELARTLGYMGLFKDDWDSYTLAGRIKEELDYAIKQDESYADAYFIYGLWNRYVSTRSMLVRMPHGLGDASAEGALRYFSIAVEKEDENAQYRLELAKQHAEMGQKDKAKKVLKETTKMKNNLFNKEYIKQAKQLLDALE